MSQHCTGQCRFYHLVKATEKGAIKTEIPIKIKVNRYVGSLFLLGYKRCKTCEIYLDYSGVFCECCNVLLATVPRNKRGKCAVKARMKRY